MDAAVWEPEVSLLDGRTVVTVHVPSMVLDEWGTYTPGEVNDVEVACTVKWGEPTVSVGLDVAPSTVVHVLAREWPEGAVAGTRFSWDGDLFEQVGVPQRFYGSAETSHVRVRGRHVATGEAGYNG